MGFGINSGLATHFLAAAVPISPKNGQGVPAIPIAS